MDFDYQCVRLYERTSKIKKQLPSAKYSCGYQRSNHTMRNAVHQKITLILFFFSFFLLMYLHPFLTFDLIKSEHII